ncbi:MAG: hypothetical protein JWN76_2072 [Chitinophagaceae bacterium]|nr:hypothetical protein [Chitinophagaceae bacterium]
MPLIEEKIKGQNLFNVRNLIKQPKHKTFSMRNTLKLEEAAMTVLGIYLLTIHNLNISAWIWFFIFFSPDASMLGYLFNSKVGAITYNLFHHKGIAIACMSVGYLMKVEMLLSIGILLFAHASFDRVMGYGLKYYTGFNDTHLGKLKKDKTVDIAPL